VIDTKELVPQLQKQVEVLTEDLIAQAKAVAATTAFLREHYKKAIEAGRLSQSFEEWSEDYLEQVAVSWVLACVFVRFLEDNRLIDECWIAGEGDRGKLADGHYDLYFSDHPHDSDREYLKQVFREVGKIPAAAELFDDEKTPLWAVDPSGDAARRLLLFFKEIDAEEGGLKRTFATPDADTRFLGDVYQDLSQTAKKKYALLQTPDFVEAFILDRTLTPAIAEFGLAEVRLIDPTCGSGHFLLSAFARLYREWCKPAHTTGNARADVQKALDAVHGVDVNPFAVAIARFRLVIAATRAAGDTTFPKHGGGWKLNLAVGDSLLRGSRPSFGEVRKRILVQQEIEFEPVQKLRTEDPKAANDILDQGYHVVVGNPPYITVKDKQQNQNYRDVYSTCHRQYSLGVPFTQRFWDLAIRKGEPSKANTEAVSPAAGYIGMITANSFMKREFGKKLIEDFFPKADLTHVIDTSGAYIPGHGTPTVILFGRPREPVDNTVRAVLGIKGEPSTPSDPAKGLVWQSILRQIDQVNASDEFTSTADVLRETYAKHPWSIGGGGAADVKEMIESNCSFLIEQAEAPIGRAVRIAEEEVFMFDVVRLRHSPSPRSEFRAFLLGEMVRDWNSAFDWWVWYPYFDNPTQSKMLACIWPWKSTLANRSTFQGVMADAGLQWYEYMQHTASAYRTPLSIAFAFVATHNHFVLDRGGKVFKQSAPIIKLPADATEDDHLGLLGLLNSSTACFWMQQTFHNKGGPGGGSSKDEKWHDFYEFSGTSLQRFPVPESKPLSLSRRLDEIARRQGEQTANRVLERWTSGEDLKTLIEEAEAKSGRLRRQMIALQEELDWECYRHYGLLADDLCYAGDDLPELKLGERAFEIVMARLIVTGKLSTKWFEWLQIPPLTELPAHWPAAYRTLVECRIKLIETNKEIGLIERPDCKRRWESEPWAEQRQRALKNFLLDRLETPAYRKGTAEHPEFTTTAQMADVASADAAFLEVAALYRGRPDFNLATLVAELVEAEAVPFLPVLRYKPAGLRKREVWERTWDLQRKQDVGENVGDIPVPPKYTSADFLKSDYWRLRGKLDVPKERWVSYPHCSTDSDPTLVVGWAGWTHLQQATAVIAYYDTRKREGWDAKRLTPLLAGLDQLLPWVKQWHPEVDAEFGESAGQSFQTLLESDAHELGLTLDAVRGWTPPEKSRKARTPSKRKKEPEPAEEDA
jgi:hypothetical protein